MANRTKARRQFTEHQNQEAVALCMQESLSCNALAQRLACTPTAWPVVYPKFSNSP